MIKSITIKNVASYDHHGVVIDPLNKINFIYGSNGSGKTTISNLIANELESCFSDSNLTWQHGFKIKSLVYNKKFRESNFGNSTIEGVFTLSQATKEEIEKIELKKKELGEIKNTVVQNEQTLENLKKDRQEEENLFKEKAWNKVYKHNEENFKEAFKGFMQKEKFKAKLLYEQKTNNQALVTLDILIEKYSTIFGKTPEQLPYITNISFERLSNIEDFQIWKKKIIGKSDVDIAILIQRLNINDWVSQGKLLLQDDDDVCPFCQQKTITTSFREKLENYFDETFTQAIKEIQALSKEYNTLSQSIKNELNQREASEKINAESKLDIEHFTSAIKTFSDQITTNHEKLNNKIKEPSRELELISTKDMTQTIELIIRTANETIKKHNDIVDNYRSEKQKLLISIWRYLVESFREETNQHISKINGLAKGIENLEKKAQEKRTESKKLDEEIKTLSNNVSSIEPTITKINTTLKQFGFLNFEIVPSKTVKNHYQLQRENGELAESSLSEGEITFLTFLYFMQLAIGSTDKNSISDERILVVDDPISSLDSTVLFVVSTILKRLIKDINTDVGNVKQLILLTHNVYFHREVSFINGREELNNITSYWILGKKNLHSTIQSFGINNPIKTSYELLWRELKYKEHNSGVTIQNTMRRIIENYFKILGKYGDDDLIQKFTGKEEREICRALISWINDGSHSIADDLYIELQEDAIEKYLKVFRDIFILTNHEEHYKMMMT